MSEATVTPEATGQDNGATPVVAQAEQSREQLFRWSQWVHVGDGAAECEKREDGKCDDAEHFHAWVRLPNPFQIRDITEKASAARARKLRDLRDESSDARIILENDLQDFGIEKELLVDEIIEADFAEDYTAAVRDVEDRDEPDYEPKDDDEEIPKLYAHIDTDREEYERQVELPEEQRSEEYEQLQKRLADYGRAIEEEMEKLKIPRREKLMGRETEELIEMVRRGRMEKQGLAVYLHEYHTWQWYVCTYKRRTPKGISGERVWPNIAEMKYEAPSDVIETLRETFASLERAMGRNRMAKNS